MEIPNSEVTLQHYSRLNRCSGLLLAPLLDVRVLCVEQHFLRSHPVFTEAGKSMTARISSQSLTAYLTTSKIRDGSWRGTDTVYLNHWNEQMRKLMEYSQTTPMTDDFKLTRHNLKNSNCRFCVCPSSVLYVKPYSKPRATNCLLP
jgi:hypothetical protein